MASGRQKIRFPSELLTRYRPIRPLGAGGMGAVFLCRELSEYRNVAIKVLRDPHDASLLARFSREADTLSRIHHPNLLRIMEHGDTSLGPYIVTEYLEGERLDELTEPFDVLKSMLQVAGGLDAMHEMGLIHRDVKPTNIMLTDDGRAVLIDFGLVHAVDDTTLTREGAVVGTACFIAPEQMRAEKPTSASDWYGWGISLFQLLEHRFPYDLPDLLKIAGGADVPGPEFRAIDPDGPLAELIRRAISPDPRRRPRSRAEAEAVLKGEALPEPPAPEDDGILWVGEVKPIGVLPARPPPPAPDPAPQAEILIVDEAEEEDEEPEDLDHTEPNLRTPLPPAAPPATPSASDPPSIPRAAPRPRGHPPQPTPLPPDPEPAPRPSPVEVGTPTPWPDGPPPADLAPPAPPESGMPAPPARTGARSVAAQPGAPRERPVSQPALAVPARPAAALAPRPAAPPPGSGTPASDPPAGWTENLRSLALPLLVGGILGFGWSGLGTLRLDPPPPTRPPPTPTDDPSPLPVATPTPPPPEPSPAPSPSPTPAPPTRAPDPTRASPPTPPVVSVPTSRPALRTPAPVAVMEGHASAVLCMARSRDGNRLATGGADHAVRLYDLTSNRPTARLEASWEPVRAVAFSPDGSRLATTGSEGAILVWDTKSGEIADTLMGGDADGVGLHFTAAEVLLAVDQTGGLIEWKPGSGGRNRVQLPNSGRTSVAPAFARAPGASLFVFVHPDGSVEARRDPTRPGVLLAPAGPEVTALAIAEGGAAVALGTVDGTIPVFTPDGATLGPKLRIPGIPTSLALSEDGTRVIAGDAAGRLHHLEVATGRDAPVAPGHSGPVRALAFLADPTRLASGGQDGQVRIWSLGP